MNKFTSFVAHDRNSEKAAQRQLTGCKDTHNYQMERKFLHKQANMAAKGNTQQASNKQREKTMAELFCHEEGGKAISIWQNFE